MSDDRTTIIYSHGGGRFGNQLLRFVHWAAWVEEHAGRFAVVDLPFWPFAEYFSTWNLHPGCRYPLASGGVDRLASLRRHLPSWVLRKGDWRFQRLVFHLAAASPAPRTIATVCVPDGASVDMTEARFLEQVSGASLCVVSGWELSCWAWLEKHQSTVRRLFAPAAPLAGTVAPFIHACRSGHRMLIGILIRRTDYREWHDGRYFFPVESYVRWVCELVEVFADSRPCVLVASDEKIDPQLFAGLPVRFATGTATGTGHWIENFLELAACDLIVSPPSTFSGCAALLGGVALLPLREPQQNVDRGQVLADGILGAAMDPDFSRAVR